MSGVQTRETVRRRWNLHVSPALSCLRPTFSFHLSRGFLLSEGFFGIRGVLCVHFVLGHRSCVDTLDIIGSLFDFIGTHGDIAVGIGFVFIRRGIFLFDDSGNRGLGVVLRCSLEHRVIVFFAFLVQR